MKSLHLQTMLSRRHSGKLKTFKASLYSSEKHIIFNNVLLMNRRLALKVFKLDKHLWQCGLLKIKCSRAAPSNDFIFNNPLAIGLYLLQKTRSMLKERNVTLWRISSKIMWTKTGIFAQPDIPPNPQNC